jgi:catechol 2,3-dioxygenase-like lactoylglutathione lyase family enzyme
MSYDPVRRQVVLFGGVDSVNASLGDTWVWDGRRWTQRAVEGPPGRAGHRLAFDTRRGVLVLFGGSASGNRALDDTWEWNGRRWSRIATPAAPSPRFSGRMAYDEARGRTVLFGGRSGNANLADTWEYDGRTWTRLPTGGPAPRHFHDMVYDARARSTLLFGGFDAPAATSDLWAFDGTWREHPRPDAAAPTPFTVQGAFVGLFVSDLEASTTWYRETFGLDVVMDTPWSAQTQAAARVLQANGLTVELVQQDGAISPRTLIPAGQRGYMLGVMKAGFVVDDFDGAVAALRAKRVEIVAGPFPKRPTQPANVLFRDNAGNLLQILGR